MNIKISICLLFLCYNTASIFSNTQKSDLPVKDGFQDQDSLQLLDYTFKDLLDNEVRISDFKGKVVLIDLWYSGCGACISCNQALNSIHKTLINKNVVFLSISVDDDKNLWMQSITKNAAKSKLNPWAGKYYSSPGTIALYCGTAGVNHDFVKKYNSKNLYPMLMLVDTAGRLVSHKLPRPEVYSKELIQEIEKQF